MGNSSVGAPSSIPGKNIGEADHLLEKSSPVDIGKRYAINSSGSLRELKIKNIVKPLHIIRNRLFKSSNNVKAQVTKTPQDMEVKIGSLNIEIASLEDRKQSLKENIKHLEKEKSKAIEKEKLAPIYRRFHLAENIGKGIEKKQQEMEKIRKEIRGLVDEVKELHREKERLKQQTIGGALKNQEQYFTE